MEFGDLSVDAATVRAVAERYGIECDEAASSEWADGIEETAGLLAGFEATVPDSRKARNLDVGTDRYDAFRYEFDLSGGSGPLSGTDLAVKDNLAVAGVPMTCGSDAVSFEPEYSATVVDRLLDAGGSVVGTTNMDEFAYFTTGETCAHGRVGNPELDGRVPGGSSAGSGAAVAAGRVPAALGSDTGGSIRIPASFCGVVGLKPTHRSVPRFGFADLAPSLDHVGPLARDVETAAEVFEAIAGPDPRDPSSLFAPSPEGVAAAADEGVDGLRIGVVADATNQSTDGVSAAVTDAVRDLASRGAETDRLRIDGFGDAPLALAAVSGAEFATLVGNEGQTYGTGTGYAEPWRAAVERANGTGEYGENVREQLLTHGTLTAATGGANYVAAQDARREFVERVRARFGEFDALVTPTTPITAPEFGEIDDDAGLLRTIANTGPFNLTGHPALSVPCGELEGRPVGLQVVADYHDEATAVRVGAAVERMRS